MSEDLDALIDEAWRQSYFDAPAALAIGRRIVEATRDAPTGPEAAWGWLHVGLAEVRVGDAKLASEAVDHARELFTRLALRRGVALSDEVRAILLRRSGDVAGSAQLHEQIDERPDRGYNDHDRFIAHNSRAITFKLLGRIDDALRHFYEANAAARRTGWTGPQILALGNLGGFHQDLFNLEDARNLCQQTMERARAVGARQSVGTAAANLIIIHYALGQPVQARAMAEFLITHGDELLPGALDRHPLPMALAHYGAGEISTAQRYLDRGAHAGIADGDGRAFWTWLQARCALARGDAAAAREATQAMIGAHERGTLMAQPYDLLQVYRAAADAAEQLGDLAAALAYTRRAQTAYEALVGRSARARYIALEVAHQVDTARRERDEAMQSLQTVEGDRARLAELNVQLQAKIAETERLQAQLKEQALRDPLTGLHNRRYLFEMAPRLLDIAQRQASPLCVIVLDLDRFKQLNDQHGHEAGDEALRGFSALLNQSVRRSDVVCRHGGEEFVIVMPDITLEGAQAMLQRLLEAYGRLRITVGGTALPALSFSAGIALLARHGTTLDQLLSRADRALYAAKEGGRSRIEVAPASGFAALS